MASGDGNGRVGPLAGIRVLEIASLLAGPFVGRLMSDYGADVVKLEDARQSDPSRNWTPAKDGVALGFTRVNSNKRSIGVNLREPAGRDLVLRLAPHFDVIIEAFRPGRMAEWGLDAATIRAANPRVVLLHVSGFGQTGPYRMKPGFGTVAEAVGGFAFVNGYPNTPPTNSPFGLGDQVAGLAATFAVCAALVKRERTGEGEEIDVSLYEPMMTIMGELLTRYSALGEIEQRVGDQGKVTSPRGIFETRDGGWVCIAGSAQAVVRRLFEAMGEPQLIDDPRFKDNAARLANDAELKGLVRDWVAQYERDEALAILDKHEVAAGPVNDARDLVTDPGLRERKSVVDLHHSKAGDIAVPGLIAKMASLEEPERGDPPKYAEHTAELLRELLDMSDSDIEDLARGGVINVG